MKQKGSTGASELYQITAGRTYMTKKRQFAWKLHTGEDEDGEFLLQLVQHTILRAV